VITTPSSRDSWNCVRPTIDAAFRLSYLISHQMDDGLGGAGAGPWAKVARFNDANELPRAPVPWVLQGHRRHMDRYD
jgi:hypothetical protein